MDVNVHILEVTIKPVGLLGSRYLLEEHFDLIPTITI